MNVKAQTAESMSLRTSRRGLNVGVYERAVALRDVGAGMVLWPNGTRVFDEIGFPEQVVAMSGASERFLITANSARHSMKPISARITIALGLAWLALVSSPLAGQTAGSDEFPTADSSSSQSAQTPPATPTQPPQGVSRPVSWKLLLPNFVSDQQQIWTFPSRLERKRNWVPTAAILAAAAGLVALDPTEANYFRQSPTYHAFNNVFTSNRTMYATLLTPAGLYVAGLARKDSKMTGTALFAGEALVDVGLLSTFLKDVTRRVRPANVPPHGNAYDTWFESGGSIISGHGGFPSGHTIAAMSVATVVARRYRNHRWVPWVAYGGAALVGFSRVSLSAHFASDVFVGGALGYSISRFAVLQQ